MPHTADMTLPGVVHDLNNVFQTLGEAADLLSTDPRWTDLSAAILRSVERGRGVTASLCTSGEPCPFEQVLQNAIAFAEDSLISGRGPNIRFACEVEPGIKLPRKWAWERVLINLFSNAIRAMQNGGVIHVRARGDASDVEIVIRDEGPGIPEDILPRIFLPHVTTKRSGGLGLYIVDSIVREDGGSVRAANWPQGGAQFTISVPADAIHVAAVAT